MKNKNLIIGGIIAMVLIVILLYFFVKKAKSGTITETKVTDQGSGNIPSEQTSAAATKESTSPVTSSLSSILSLPSWLSWLTGSGSSPVPGTTVYSTLYDSTKFPLKSGSKGSEVLNLQKYLNYHVVLPYAKLNEDSNFGPLTKAALQRSTGLTEVTESWYRANILSV